MLKCLWKGKVLTRAVATSLLRQNSSHTGLGQDAWALPAHTSGSPLLTATKGKVSPGQERKQCQGSQSQCSSQWQTPQSADTGTRHPLLGEKPADNCNVKYQVRTSTAARTRILPNKEDRRTPLCYGHVKSSCWLHLAHPTATYHVAVRLYELAPKSFLRIQDRVCT